jgi:hypothetical protein
MYLVHRQTVLDVLIDDQVYRMAITNSRNLFDRIVGRLIYLGLLFNLTSYSSQIDDVCLIASQYPSKRKALKTFLLNRCHK